MKTTVATLLAALLTLTCAVGLAQAQLLAPAPKQAAETIPPLTDESLLTMLTNMGYKVKTEKTEKGNIYNVTIQRGTWTYIIDVSLSPSKTKLWFSGWLSELPKGQKVSADRLLDLLEGSWVHGPAHFRYHRGFNQLNLGLCHDNKNIGPAELREQLESFMGTMKKTELLWNVKKWKQADQVTIGKPAGKAEGK